MQSAVQKYSALDKPGGGAAARYNEIKVRTSIYVGQRRLAAAMPLLMTLGIFYSAYI